MEENSPSQDLLREVLRIRSMAAGYWNAWCIQAAIELDLFSALENRAQSSEDLAATIGREPSLVASLLEVLAMNGILLKDASGQFSNGYAASAALVKGAPLDQTGSIRHNQAAQVMGPYFPKIFEPGFQLPKAEGAKEGPEGLFQAAVSVARLKAPILLPFLDLGEREKVVDLGAGSGGYVFAMAAERTDLVATLVEHGFMAEGARSLVEDMGLGERVSVVDGDFLTIEFGSDYTLALLSHIVHFVPFETSQTLLRRAWNSLASGGRVVVHDLLRERPENPSIEAELLNMDVFLRHGIGVPTCAEVTGWLDDAGFVDPQTIAMPVGQNTAIIARKP